MGLEYIENDRVRKETFSKRGKTLEKSTRELATLCDIPAVMICFGADQEVGTWPQNSEEILDISGRYRRLSPHESRKHRSTLAAYVDQNVLEDVRPINQRPADIPYEDAVEATRSMETMLHFVGERIKFLTRQRNLGRNCSNVRGSYGMGGEGAASFGDCQRQRRDDMDCVDAEPSSDETGIESMVTENCDYSEEEATAISADHIQKMKTIRIFGNNLTVYTD